MEWKSAESKEDKLWKKSVNWLYGGRSRRNYLKHKKNRHPTRDEDTQNKKKLKKISYQAYLFSNRSPPNLTKRKR